MTHGETIKHRHKWLLSINPYIQKCNCGKRKSGNGKIYDLSDK